MMFIPVVVLVLVSLPIYESRDCGILYLTVSSLADKKIEITWNLNCVQPPYLLKLNNSQKIFDEITVDKSYGYYKSRQSFPRKINFPGNWNKDDVNPIQSSLCLDFFVSVIKNGEKITETCLNIEPVWMQNFGPLRIGEMMIPGTHNSGAYKGLPPLLKNFVLTQERSIYEQLVMGIRYFDIRIGRYDKTIYINHDLFRCVPLKPELQSILSFVKKSPREVIVLNFHRFPVPSDFKIQYHKEVLDLVWGILGNYIYPRSDNIHLKGPKLQEIWQSGKSIIVSYNQKAIVDSTNWLWYTVVRDWGDVQKVEKLEQYVENSLSVENPGNPMRVLMAELTPHYDISPSLLQSLRYLADLVNPKLDSWLRYNKAADRANIIATDFFMGNNVINLSIETNKNKLMKTTY